MVKHMIIWSLKDDIDKESVKAEIKKQLEGLVGKIDGLLDMKIITNGLPSSKGDLLMDSTFESNDALKAYAVHSLHVAVADGIVRPNTASRAAYDYEV
ncbi:MAG: Dabb family protein [Clostridia bacterium]|nr:Dabb family protein [Clostridia bacterium]